VKTDVFTAFSSEIPPPQHHNRKLSE